ncbi:MAG: cardiolipin synthase [Lachnospiraceae bacterium]|nr:cardiolipin synthase [Lachnospiraceae bacterium]
MSDSEVLSLAKTRKKGILRILFSRILVILLLIILQISLWISVYGWFREYLPHFSVFTTIFTLTMFVYLFNVSMDASAKITWLFIMSLAPIPSSIFLAYTRSNLGHRLIRKRVEMLTQENLHRLPQDERVLEEIGVDRNGTDDLCRYVAKTGCYPVFANTEVTYYPLGEAKFKDMLEELAKAEHYIFMEYFIVQEGYMWGRILKILAEKAQAGVDVRVMYDGMCELTLLPYNYPKLMEKVGIKCKAFSPLTPFLSTHYNNRDHRKILVIDGKVAFNGGVNLSDEYINHIKVFGHWKDTAVRLKGDAVASFALMFLQMWNIDEKEPEFDKFLHPIAFAGKNMQEKAEDNVSGYVMPYADSPMDGERVGESVYMDILYRANDYVHIMTPYLILDGELETALKYAAQRGVDVKLILPGIPDKITAYALAKTHYYDLVKAGVQIYEYTPGFVHAKVFVSDDEKAVVGTINLDYRSLYHHFECATYLYKTDCVTDIEADYQETLGKCRQVTMESIRKEKVWMKLLGQFIKLIAPMM